MSKRALDFEKARRTESGLLNMTSRRQAEKHVETFELKNEDTINKTKWRKAKYRKYPRIGRYHV